MKTECLTRRDVLLNCAALGSLAVAPSFSLAETIAVWQEQGHKATAWDEIGPFYKRDAPQNAHLRAPGPHVPGCWALDLLRGES